MRLKHVLLAGLVMSCWLGATSANAFDEDAAKHLMKKSNCFKCHAIDKKKDAPSYQEIAKKMKSKPDAEKELYTHLTTHPKVKVEGKEEEHASLKTKDDAEIKNVIQFILAQ
jgi:cytochrome c